MDGTIQAIIKLWNEARNPLYIAQKLGLYDELGNPDVEKVEMVVDDPDNYRRQYA
jgi:hypothetical protein